MSTEMLKNIETAFKTVLQAAIDASGDTDFDSVQIYCFHIDGGDRTLPNISVVATSGFEELAPGRGFYHVPVNVASGTHLPSDENRAILSKLDALVYGAITADSIGNQIDSPICLMGLELGDGESVVGDQEASENTQQEIHQYILPVVDTTFLTTTTTT
jgi:hypothetical protein